MTIHNLDKIFEPASVAVIGASKKTGTMGCFLLNSLKQSGYKGKIFPINPKYKSLKDLRSYPSISDVESAIDLAVIATPIGKAPSLIQECVKNGVGGAIIISAGGEAEIKKEAAKSDIRIIGPNCMGIVSAGANLNASFTGMMPLPGKLAFVSQSGAICSSILDYSLKQAIGFQYFVSIGSMLDVDFGDMINYLGNDPQVSSIVLYIESLTNIRKFMSAARAVSRIKPIVVLKAGKSRAGARAASSHTGALAGEDAVYSAAFKRAGIVRVNTIEELFDCAELMAKQPIPKGQDLAIITNGGGPGVMATDALSDLGLEPVLLTPETIEHLNKFLPPFWSKGNPIDILGNASPERWRQTVNVCLKAREIDAMIIIFVPQTLSNAVTVATAIAEILDENSRMSVFAVWMGGENVEKGRQLLNKAGVPTYDTPERAVSAFMYMHSYARNLDMLQQIPSKMPRSLQFNHSEASKIIENGLEAGHKFMTEMESKALLKAYGIPVNQTEVAASVEESVAVAQKIGYPVALKIHSRDISHKSDADCVKLNLRHPDDVRTAFLKIMKNARNYNPNADLLGVSIQPMLKRPDYELILGCKLDKDFGPAILFGMGGIMTEILKDRAIALPPLNRLLAQRLMESTRVFQMLKGFRNRAAAGLDLLEEILVRLSQLVTDFPEIEELDMNPMLLVEDRVVAVDARAIIKPTRIKSPLQLVISPYPNQYEMMATTKTGINILIRPIRPEDAPLMVELFRTLSPQTIYYRFFMSLKTISHEMLVQLTQIDYDRDMALVAIQETEGKEQMLGVARIMTNPGGESPEFAVLVGDPWQGRGVGAKLMEHLLAIAGERQLESISGIILGANRNMLAFARKFGFEIVKVPDSPEYKVSINLKTEGRGPLKIKAVS